MDIPTQTAAQRSDLLDLISLVLPEQPELSDDNQWFELRAPDNKLMACIGLETFGHYGIVNSLVVKKCQEENGLGAKLLTFIEHHAMEMGLAQLYLLTSSAQTFFKNQHFHRLELSDLPEEILESQRLADINAKDTVIMTKPLIIGG